MTDEEAAELSQTVTMLVDTCRAHESLISDLLQCIASMDRDALEPLRQQAVSGFELCKGRKSAEFGVWAPYWAERFTILNAVLTRAGSPLRSAEVVSLDSFRRRP
mgnify:CR=1 FL=1